MNFEYLKYAWPNHARTWSGRFFFPQRADAKICGRDSLCSISGGDLLESSPCLMCCNGNAHFFIFRELLLPRVAEQAAASTIFFLFQKFLLTRLLEIQPYFILFKSWNSLCESGFHPFCHMRTQKTNLNNKERGDGSSHYVWQAPPSHAGGAEFDSYLWLWISVSRHVDPGSQEQ